MNETLVVVGGVLRLQPCALYKTHQCAVVQAHHICPQSWFKAAGVPVQTPMIDLCPTCHMDIHAAIDGMLKGEDVSAVPPRCRALAVQAFKIAQGKGLTPAPTL